ncbi:MAG TPA: TadE family protein [Elusimicrobiota bacterium]|nr:TadE family protein [Elusimicrobiota bacterium]
MKGLKTRTGQVVVEMILILPVFLGIVFTIMEIGNVSFRLIVLNHATYEVARVGGMTWLLPSGGPSKLSALMTSILPQATVSCTTDRTLMDPQAGIQNMDLVCTGSENVRLIFPISSIMLSSKGAPPGTRALHATVRMPIEQPLPQ